MPAGELRTAVLLLLGVFMRVLSCLEIKCTVSHNGDRTTYKLQDGFCDTDVKEPQFSWFNTTGHVLANHQDRMEVVTSSSFSALTTTRCIEHILCEGHVTSKGEPLDYSANCTTACSPAGDEGTLRHWVAAGVIVFLLLAAVGAFLGHRKRSCFYSPVKTGNPSMEPGNAPPAQIA